MCIRDRDKVTIEHRRVITEQEIARFQRKVSLFRRLKGYKLMWSSARFVRLFTIDKVIPVNIGKMTASPTSYIQGPNAAHQWAYFDIPADLYGKEKQVISYK